MVKNIKHCLPTPVPIDTTAITQTTGNLKVIGQGETVHIQIMFKGENEEDSVIKSEITALSGNVAKSKVSENTPSKYMAKEEEDQALKARQALCQYPADSENSSVEYIAKGEEDMKAEQASLNYAHVQQEDNQDFEDQQARMETFVSEGTEANQFEDKAKDKDINNQDIKDMKEAAENSCATVDDHAENDTALHVIRQNEYGNGPNEQSTRASFSRSKCC
ncbi:hypothetical protein MAM1_0614c11021 [Mucor ambiguus]|uniref:Uncharacterized protein n=1 Tax=Mucor ambiguus TaxID=91626 RepID=A0A0C9N9N9_9FUNG|nr:hypothetical protein MAM1_0614c11021 [Mucor ambiguus]